MLGVSNTIRVHIYTRNRISIHSKYNIKLFWSNSELYKELTRCFKIEEIWKDYVYIYEISNFGQLRNKNTGRIRKLAKSSNGYLNVVLTLGSSDKKKNISIHRAVAETFIPNPNPEIYTDVNHIDGDKTNNRVDNLEWVTHSENNKHAYKIGKQISNKLTPEDIEYIRVNYEKGDKEWGCASLARQFNVSTATIYNIVQNNIDL